MLKKPSSATDRGACSARTGWFLLFIWSVWFVWLNQTNQMNKTNQMNQSCVFSRNLLA
jgi:low temperature requirement protein LtrA